MICLRSRRSSISVVLFVAMILGLTVFSFATRYSPTVVSIRVYMHLIAYEEGSSGSIHKVDFEIGNHSKSGEFFNETYRSESRPCSEGQYWLILTLSRTGSPPSVWNYSLSFRPRCVTIYEGYFSHSFAARGSYNLTIGFYSRLKNTTKLLDSQYLSVEIF